MSESYDEFRRHGTRWLLIERIVGVVMILFGLFLWGEGDRVFPIALILIGALELCSNYIRKFFWLRRHFTSKLANASLELTFDAAGFHSRGPFTSGEMAWSGVEKVIRTPKGVIIWPQKGTYIYLSQKSVGDDVINFIVSRAAAIAA